MTRPPAGYATILRMEEMLDPWDGVRKVSLLIETWSGSQVVILTAARVDELDLFTLYRNGIAIPLPLC